MKAARLPKDFKFIYLMGRQLQFRFMRVLYSELIYRDRRYQHPRLSIPKEDDDILIVSDIVVASDFAVNLDNGSCNFGLDIMGLVWSLKDYSFSRPPNLADENSDIME